MYGRGKINLELRLKVEELRKQGLLHEEIAKEVGRSRSRVTQILSSGDVTQKGLRGIKQPIPKLKAKPKKLKKQVRPKIRLQQIMEAMFGASATGLHDILLQFMDMEVYRVFLRRYMDNKPKLWKYNPKTGDIVIRRVPLDGNRSFTVNMHRKGTIQVRIACTGFGNEIKTPKELDALTFIYMLELIRLPKYQLKLFHSVLQLIGLFRNRQGELIGKYPIGVFLLGGNTLSLLT